MAILDNLRNTLNQSKSAFTNRISKLRTTTSNIPELQRTAQFIADTPKRFTFDNFASNAESFSLGAGRQGLDTISGIIDTTAELGSKVSGVKSPKVNLSKKILPKGTEVARPDAFAEGVGRGAFDIALLYGGGSAAKKSSVVQKAQQTLGPKASKLAAKGAQLEKSSNLVQQNIGSIEKLLGKGLANLSQGIPYDMLITAVRKVRGEAQANLLEEMLYSGAIGTVAGALPGPLKNIGASVSHGGKQAVKQALTSETGSMTLGADVAVKEQTFKQLQKQTKALAKQSQALLDSGDEVEARNVLRPVFKAIEDIFNSDMPKDKALSELSNLKQLLPDNFKTEADAPMRMLRGAPFDDIQPAEVFSPGGRKKTLDIFRGEGSQLQNIQRESGVEDLFGKGRYFSDNPEFAGAYGNVQEVLAKIKSKEILEVPNQDTLEKLIKQSTDKYPDLPVEEAVPKLAKDLGYKAIKGFDSINLVDDAVQVTPKAGGIGVPPPKPPASGLDKIGTPAEKAPDTKSLIDSVKDKFNELYTQGVDRFNPLSQTAKKAGQNDAMQKALTQYYGTGSTANGYIEFDLKPILNSVDANDLRAYTIAQRDIELAGRGIKGSSAESADEVINTLKGKYGGDIKNLDEAANKLYDYQKKIVKEFLVDSGVISKESYEAALSQNQKYIPFKRVMDDVDDFLGIVPDKSVGSVGSQNVFKKIGGSDKAIIDPLESIVENTYKMVAIGRRNNVAKTIASFADKVPDLIKKFDGEVGNKPTISVLEDGKAQKYLVPTDVAEAAKGLTEEATATVFKILSAPTKLVRATATGINPEFLPTNVVRDLQSAFVNAGLNPLEFTKGLAHLIKKDDVYQEFLKAGGKTSRISLDRPFLKESVETLTNKRSGYTVKKPSDILNILQNFGEYSEQPTRIALFENALKKNLKKGVSKEEALVRAANAAQEGTVNFARRGSKTQTVNSLIAFFNARLQGTDRLVRSVKNDPKGTMLRLGLVTQVPAVLAYMNNKNFKSYNNENVVSQSDKDNNYIFMLSDEPIKELGGAQYLKIPKGDVGKFANPTTEFLAYLDGKDSDALEEIGKAFVSLSPVNTMGDVLPSGLKPIVENSANYNFFRKQDIVPEYKKSLPAGYQDTTNTPPIYKYLGRKMGVSPAQIQNLAEGYFTGYEKLSAPLLNQVATKLDPTLKQESKGVDINRVPIVRRFLGGEKRTDEEQAESNASRVKSLNIQIGTVSNAIKKGTIPKEEGQRKIDELQAERNKLTGGSTTIEPVKSGPKTTKPKAKPKPKTK